MLKTVLFIDGENFRHKVEEVLEKEGGNKNSVDFSRIKLDELLGKVLKDFKINQKRYYVAKIHEHKETPRKSRELILLQRRLKTNLEKQGFEVIIAGHVRGQVVTIGERGKLIFREKGVDVKIAVDLVADACDKVMETAVICSSDSDLQPAVKEVRKRGVEIVYLGFHNSPNIGLTHTTNRTVLFRNSEIVASCPKRK